MGSAVVSSNNTLMDEKFVNNQLKRWGYYIDIEYTFMQGDRFNHSIGIKSASYEIFAEYLGIVYKFGFRGMCEAIWQT